MSFVFIFDIEVKHVSYLADWQWYYPTLF